jgi:hypothetical protein
MRGAGLAFVIGLSALSVSSDAREQNNFIGFMLPPELLTDCTNSADAKGLAICAGYLQGVFDELSLARTLLNRPPCTPEHLNLRDLRDAAVDFMQRNPPNGDGAASYVHTAISLKWCPSGETSLGGR